MIQLSTRIDFVLINFILIFSVRFDCQTGKIVCKQIVTLDAVTATLQTKHNIDTKRLLQRMFHAFDTLGRFPHGEYLLCGDGTASNHIKVYEKNGS